MLYNKEKDFCVCVVPIESKEPEPLHQDVECSTAWEKNTGEKGPACAPLLQPSCPSLKSLLLRRAVQTPDSFLLREDGALWNLRSGGSQAQMLLQALAV